MILPINRMWERVETAKDDSDMALFMNLMYMGEQLVKILAAGLIACVIEDKQRHKYGQIYRLVRADGIGEWSVVIDEILTGPTSQYLIPEAHQAQLELTQRLSAGSWQYDAVSLLHDCLRELDDSLPALSVKAALRTWFSSFAHLRNKTRGHGALQTHTCSKLCIKLYDSIKLISENFCLFKNTWAYLYRNLSGKYRVTYLSEKKEVFDYLKTSKNESLNNGVYIYLNKPIEVELVFSEPEANDFMFPNGNFNGKTFEVLSYITDTKESINATPYLVPAGELPPSETQGIGKLDLIGGCFSNLPNVQSHYIQRLDLEKQLFNILTNDRHPVVTLTGRGGIGKTTLALSVLDQICKKSQFNLVLWFSARDIDLLLEGAKPVKPQVLTEHDIAQEFVNLIEPKEANEKGFKPKTFMEKELTKSSLGPILIILDNFETVKSPAELFQWLDTYIRLPNKILITTRFREFKGDYPIEVKGMTELEFRKLVDSTIQILNIPRHLITDEYLDELYGESDGHPYVVKILLGEVAKAGRIEKIERIVASKEEILTALFERTYIGISPAAKRIFLTLCNWRSTVPQVAIEAVLMRSDNQRMDVEDALEELARSSFIEITQSEKDSMLFISVPLSASIFGARKLSVSPMKTSIQADTNLLQAFGAGQHTTTQKGVEPRINSFFKNIAKKISSGKENLDKYISILEFICRKYPIAWITLSSLYEEEFEFERAKEAIQNFIEAADDEKKIEGWHRFTYLCILTNDWQGVVHAYAEVSEFPNITLSQIRGYVNQLMRIFKQFGDQIGIPEKEILIQRFADNISKRLEFGKGDSDDYSRLAWLYIHLNDRKKAREIVKNVLNNDPEHYHSLSLAKKLGIYSDG
ncbi:NB-ARC domain-containing protein [Rhodocytophaga aerolata]|uniref:NB-ARC domain-containing protein n=1 Tax=Rhodocytophaga aerolata TaxID=455078 RepID=A0ABT8RKV4_9BACT|nr:NB-ARC domain-containing protein [Rhodocytophaga aerolata]MDO1451602.1 NB-ARC domain-containing protein [Rhodocytophaga aerolata]